MALAGLVSWKLFERGRLKTGDPVPLPGLLNVASVSLVRPAAAGKHQCHTLHLQLHPRDHPDCSPCPHGQETPLYIIHGNLVRKLNLEQHRLESVTIIIQSP